MHSKGNLKHQHSADAPYEKAEIYGFSSLSDTELLAIIIRSGVKGKNAIDVAAEILSDGEGNLLNLLYMDILQLQSFSGIGKIKAIELKAVAELSKRISKTTRLKKIQLDSAESVAKYYMESLRHLRREQLIACFFDHKCEMIGDELISIGTMDTALLSPREIFISALQKNAGYIIILHNHPSGNPLPSIADQEATKRIIACGNLIGISVMDHIIIGDNVYYSFREKGLI